MNVDEPTHTKGETQPESAFSYVTTEIFLDFVFGPMRKSENVPLWASPREIPGYPVNEERFAMLTRRSAAPRACYFGCSTMNLDPAGKLYNRQSQFAGFYVLVLDDIGSGVGSKLAFKDLPRRLADEPSYVIETSPDNYQFGFVLAEPIRDLELAKAFQRIVVQKSGADTGGCMPNKLVRMPCGVNLKEKYQSENGDPFGCRLDEFDDDIIWRPEGLLGAVDAGVTWGDMQDNLQASALVTRRAGTTSYRPTVPYQFNLDGVVDPILEWLNAREMIVSENGEWVTILCPQADKHSDKNARTAGYSPLGIGSRPMSRGFHCFHDSCSTFDTRAFLTEVLEMGGPRTGQNDAIEQHIARYAFEMQNNTVIDMRSETYAAFRQIGFKNQLAGDVWLPTSGGDFKAVNEYTAWSKDSNRMRFAGRQHEVGEPRVLLSSDGGYPSLNTWGLPEWGDGPFEMHKVAPFLEFIRYLIPDAEDAEWFLDHLAAKAQNPKYRGPGVIMSTPTEGTGRATLQEILMRLWGAENVASVSLSDLIAGSESSDNNSWIQNDWVLVAEAKQTDMTAKRAATAYESLKVFIEPGAARILRKEKYEVSRQIDCYGSVIVCSQHGDAIPLDSASTRFKRIENPVRPWADAKFIEFRKWIEGGFEPHLWRWLRDRDISEMSLFARQEATDVLVELQNVLLTRRSVDSAIQLCIAFAETKLGGIVLLTDFLDGLELIAGPLELDLIQNWRKPVRREVLNKTREAMTESRSPWRPMIEGKRPKPRLTALINGASLGEALAKNHKEVVPVGVSETTPPGTVRDEFIDFAREQLEEAE